MTDARFAVVVRELFGGDNHATVGHTVFRISIGFVEHVNNELAIDFDGVLRKVSVEHQASAKTALRWLTRAAHDTVGPNDRNP